MIINFLDYRDLLSYIDHNHSFKRNMGKKVKYIDSTIDMRTGEIFCITFRGLFDDQVFFNNAVDPNYCSLHVIKSWLDSEDNKKNPKQESKVYTVLRTWDYDSFAVMAAFKDKSKAEEFAEEKFKDENLEGYFYIEEVDLF